MDNSRLIQLIRGVDVLAPIGNFGKSIFIEGKRIAYKSLEIDSLDLYHKAIREFGTHGHKLTQGLVISLEESKSIGKLLEKGDIATLNFNTWVTHFITECPKRLIIYSNKSINSTCLSMADYILMSGGLDSNVGTA